MAYGELNTHVIEDVKLLQNQKGQIRDPNTLRVQYL